MVFFFVSFDPVDEQEIISDKDQDYILARNIYAYVLEPIKNP
jgi:hypothetical protein